MSTSENVFREIADWAPLLSRNYPRLAAEYHRAREHLVRVSALWEQTVYADPRYVADKIGNDVDFATLGDPDLRREVEVARRDLANYDHIQQKQKPSHAQYSHLRDDIPDGACVTARADLAKLAELVATHLPDVFEKLRLVTRCPDAWYLDANFDWEPVITELKMIETAAIQHQVGAVDKLALSAAGNVASPSNTRKDGQGSQCVGRHDDGRCRMPKSDDRSDPNHLNDWLCRIDRFNRSELAAGECSWIIFRPHREAAAAMQRLSMAHSYIVTDIDRAVQFCEEAFRKRPLDSDSLAEAMWGLQCTLEDAIEALCNPVKGDEYAGTKKLSKVTRELEAMYDRGEPYDTQRALSKRLGCSVGLIHKAIHASRKLSKWPKETTAPRGQRFDEVIEDNERQAREPDPANVMLDAEVDSVMDKLMNEAKPAEQNRLRELNEEGRRELASLYMGQRKDDQQDMVYSRP